MGLVGWENRVLEAAAKGEAADFSQEREAFLAGNGTEPVIDAKILRQFMLGLQTATPSCGVPLGHCVRWEIKGATVDDTLDLRGGRLPGGGALAPLRFVGCIFQKGFRADGAHLESLSFEGCRFGSRFGFSGDAKAGITLRDACVQGEVRMSEAAKDGDYFWLDARSIQVGSNFIIRKSKLVAAPIQERKGVSPDPYGVDLRDAKVRANIFLQPEVSIEGGLRLEGAQVQGNLWAEGLQVTDGETKDSRLELEKAKRKMRFAIRAQSARFKGHVLLRESAPEARDVAAKGSVGMYGLHAGGTVDLTGLQINNEGSNEAALLLMHARISADLLAQDLSTTGTIAAQSCNIAGNFFLTGTTGPVEAQLLQVQGYTNIAARIAGRANLWGAQLNGTLELAGAAIGTTSSPADLILTNASLQGDLNASTTLTVSGVLLLDGAHVSGSLVLSGRAEEIKGNLLTVDGDTTLGDATNSLVVERIVNLGGANLKGKLDLCNFGFFGVRTRSAAIDG